MQVNVMKTTMCYVHYVKPFEGIGLIFGGRRCILWKINKSPSAPPLEFQ